MANKASVGASIGAAGYTLHCRGDVRLFCGDSDCTPKSKKGRALLAILAAEQRPLSRVRIIDLLWSDRQEEQARASLRTLLADLKEQFNSRFDELLTVDRERVALGPSVRTDLTDLTLARPAGELFEGLDHIDPELDEWLRVERKRWASPAASHAPVKGAGPPITGKRALLLAIAASAVLALLVLFALSYRDRANPSLRNQTIAVLPLVGTATDAQRLFGEYLTQSVRDSLRSAVRAHVLGEGTSRQLGSSLRQPEDFKRKFGVDLVLATTMRAFGKDYRLTARLTETSSGSELWSAQYVVHWSQPAESRDRIVRDLVERVGSSLSMSAGAADLGRWYEGPAGDRLAEARRLILMNRPAEALVARRILLELVAADPNNVPALAALGEATMEASDHPYVGGTLPTAQAREEARAYANRAIRLAPHAADGYAALGASYLETAQAIAPMSRAVALEPGNYLYHTRLGRALEFEDRYQEAYRHQLQAVQLEPLSALPLINLIRALDQLDRDDEIRRQLAVFAARRPDPADLGYVRGYYAFLRDDNVGCVRNFRAVPLHQVRSQQRNVLLFCLTALGENGAALRLVADEDSLRRDVLVGDVELVEGRVRKLGPDFWRRHYESLAAAEVLMMHGRGKVLLEQFDAAYNGPTEFIAEGGFMTLYPQPLLVAMRQAGRHRDARALRDLLAKAVENIRTRPGGDEWESYNGASVAMADGKPERAAFLIERCTPNCVFTVLQRDISETALFRPLVGNARFDAVIREYRRMINRQRAELGLVALPLSSAPANGGVVRSAA